MNRRLTLLWTALLLGTGACNSSNGSGTGAANGVPTNILTLWEERPAPPAGATIGVYVQTTGAPTGILLLESREARVCALAAQTPVGVPAADADAGPPNCPFEQRFTVAGGDERYAVILAPLSASVPPLLAASLVDSSGGVVATVLRRFYPVTPVVEAGVAADSGQAVAGDQ